MTSFDFGTTIDGPLAVVTPTGELDLAGAAALEAELERHFREPTVTTVVVDLRRLEFMDSSGLRTLVMADARAREARSRFALVPGGEIVHRVFEITRMHERLAFVADPREALRS